MALSLLTTFNIGKDQSLAIQLLNLPGGIDSLPFNAQDLGLLEDFEDDPQNSDIVVNPISNNGVPVARSVEKGVNFSFTIARQSGAPDFLGALLRDAYYASGSGTLLARITHLTFSPLGVNYGYTQKTFDNATLRQTKGGKYAGDEKVTVSFAGFCPAPAMSAYTEVGAVIATTFFALQQAAAALRQPGQ